MSVTLQPGPPPGRVLATMNEDGSRLWIRPRVSPGRWLRARRAVAWSLIVVFVLVPYLHLGGKPLVLLDLPRREFTLFGATFLATDMLLFMLLFMSAVFAIFFVSALAGRAWCGWACPQTVYMEFLFRPVERLIEGGWRGAKKLDRHRGLRPRRILKYAVYVVLAVFLAHTFLAYFVPVEELARWVRRSPVQHPVSFFIMLGTTALMFFDFAYFREQTCLVACPYGRLQSVLLDRRSVIVGYDARRGEPRGKGIVDRPASAGDCIECRLCVLTCPTGIDIREGLQMECIHCTQCIDACDAVMDRIGKPRGLIRYSTRDRLEGRASGVLRPRILIYPAVLLATLGLFAWSLGTRAAADVTLLRAGGAPYTVEADGSIVNQVRIKIVNRGVQDRRYRIAIADAPAAALIAPVNPFPVAAGRMQTTSVFVVLPRGTMSGGEIPVTFRLDDDHGYRRAFAWRLLGPEVEPPGAAGEAH